MDTSSQFGNFSCIYIESDSSWEHSCIYSHGLYLHPCRFCALVVQSSRACRRSVYLRLTGNQCSISWEVHQVFQENVSSFIDLFLSLVHIRCAFNSCIVNLKFDWIYHIVLLYDNITSQNDTKSWRDINKVQCKCVNLPCRFACTL